MVRKYHIQVGQEHILSAFQLSQQVTQPKVPKTPQVCARNHGEVGRPNDAQTCTSEFRVDFVIHGHDVVIIVPEVLQSVVPKLGNIFIRLARKAHDVPVPRRALPISHRARPRVALYITYATQTRA